jgi:copper(I)-binding protein
VNRALRAATTVVLLVSPVALSACSAGQVTQTATQQRDKVGAMGQVGDITLRAIQLESPRGGSYDRGEDADLRLAIVNGGGEPDTLVGISGDGFADAEIDAGSTATSASTGGSSSETELEIPTDTIVLVGEDEDVSITLNDLDDALTTGQYLEITFEFENAGEITVPVTVANPDDTVERGEAFDFHHEAGTEEAAEGAQREGGE